MIRKLVRHGPSTLIVSLPAEWIKQHGLHEKDEVEIIPDKNQLIVTLKGNLKKESVTVDISSFDRTSLVLLLHAAYRAGFSKINLIFREQCTIHFRTKQKVAFSRIIHSLVGRFIGFEITKETENRIEISQVSYIDKEEVETMINRTLILLKDMLDSFCQSCRENNLSEMEKIEDKHDDTTKLVSYLIRAITKGEHYHKETGNALSHFLANVDKIIDVLKYIARDRIACGKQVSKDIYPLLKMVQESNEEYLQLFRKYNEKLIVSISQRRDDYKQYLESVKSRLSADDMKLAVSLLQSLELLFDLLEWRIYIHLKN